jgi:hypothetical protein
MAVTAAAPLDTLAQQIARQQAELEALRREYEARQARLADLTRRKQDLQAQLQRVEAEIQATTQGRTSGRALAPAKAAKAKAAPPPVPRTPVGGQAAAAAVKSVRPQTLPAFLLDLVGRSTGPVTVRQLTQEVVRQKFPTSSGNVPKLVAIKVRELVKRGLLRRAGDRPGVVLAKAAPGGGVTTAKPTAGAKKPAQKGPGVSRAATRAHANGQKQRRPLRVVLTDVLAKSRRPMAARELAAQVLANGYRTKSKNFIDVVWVMLGNMDNVRNVPGQGYTLMQR